VSQIKDENAKVTILLGLILLVATMVLFPLRRLYGSADAAMYLGRALNLYNGRGYVDHSWSPVLSRGPIFPLLLAASFELFGPSILHALWVVRVFFVLNTLLIYLLGARLYGTWPGFTASLLVLTSIVINQYSSRVLLDVVLPFFMILFVYCLYLAFDKASYPWALASGVVLGIAFLTKEMAIIFVPLPFLVALSYVRCRGWGSLLLALCCAAAFCLALAPWVVHGLRVSSAVSLDHQLGAGPEVLHDLLTPETGSTRYKFLERFPLFYVYWFGIYCLETVAPNFVLAPLFLVGWSWTLVKGLSRGDLGDRLMLTSFLLFTPIMLFQGRVAWRVGQSILIFMLSYIVLARTVWDLAYEGVSRLGSWLRQLEWSIPVRQVQRAVAALLVVILLALQLCNVDTVRYLVRDTRVVPGVLRTLSRRGWAESILLRMVSNSSGSDRTMAEVLGSPEFHLDGSGWLNDATRAAGSWLAENVPPGASIVSDRWGLAVYFFAGGDFRFPMDLRWIQEEVEQADPRVLFLWKHKHDVKVLTEECLLRRLEKAGVQYVIVTWKRNYFSLYFEAHPGFEKAAEFGDGEGVGKVQIFSVGDDLRPVGDFSLHVQADLVDYLEKLRLSDETAYQRLVQGFFGDELGWTEAQVEGLIDGTTPFVPVEAYREY
jgi:4-amino-4-deoxy-L-arabinose transferase-like glycosyltransferase